MALKSSGERTVCTEEEDAGECVVGSLLWSGSTAEMCTCEFLLVLASNYAHVCFGVSNTRKRIHLWIRLIEI